MRRFKLVTGLFLLMMIMPIMAFALSPAEVLNKAKAKIASSKSVSADFRMTTAGRTTTGKLLTKGSKFALTSNFTSSWYDGTSLYVYNAATGETTVMKPSAAELGEANPLTYINMSANYNVTASKQKTAGTETVVLVPKKGGSGIKSVMIQISTSTFLPTNITVTPSSGGKVTITLSNIKLNAAVADSQFAYPKSKYPKAKIVDLR